ncbi:MAG: PIG-L family deacetylase [Acidimicrobiia bacterium]|nr:PIG-L family deacetylase [Acidimicrobiia bacterium]
MNEPMRVLVLSPHTDDGEFGCGGTIAKLIAGGHDVHYVAFSAAEKSVPDDLPSDILRTEVIAATGILSIPRENLRVLDFEVRDFPRLRQDILEVMVQLQQELDPQVVFLPSTSDTHQDHQTVSAEGFRAFKRTTLLGYELPWNNLTFTTGAFALLEQDHVELKIAALAAYESQADRSYSSPEFIRSLARVRGTQVGAEYAETFEAIRYIF